MIIIPSTISFLSGACGQGTGSGRTVRNGEHHGDVNVVPREHEVAPSDDSNKVSSRWNIMKFYHASMELAHNTFLCPAPPFLKERGSSRGSPGDSGTRACGRVCACVPACLRVHACMCVFAFSVGLADAPPQAINLEQIPRPTPTRKCRVDYNASAIPH